MMEDHLFAIHNEPIHQKRCGLKTKNTKRLAGLECHCCDSGGTCNMRLQTYDQTANNIM